MESKRNEIAKVEQRTILPAVATAVGDNYNVELGNGNSLVLVRDVDFGKIQGTSKPCLFKSGAERILFSMGLFSRYELVDKVEQVDGENPYFFYLFKCSLYKVIGGTEYHITDGYGSANTRERQCGRANPYDTANSRLKMAKKRAMVDACLLVGQLSNAFAQDIENDDVQSATVTMRSDDDPITTQQVKRIWAIAGQYGYSTNEAKAVIADAGYESVKAIKQKDYDSVCAMFAPKGEK